MKRSDCISKGARAVDFLRATRRTWCSQKIQLSRSFHPLSKMYTHQIQQCGKSSPTSLLPHIPHGTTAITHIPRIGTRKDTHKKKQHQTTKFSARRSARVIVRRPQDCGNKITFSLHHFCVRVVYHLRVSGFSRAYALNRRAPRGNLQALENGIK